MSSLVRDSRSEKQSCDHRTPERYTPEIDPERRPFYASLPPHEGQPLDTGERHAILRLLPDLRRDVRLAASPEAKRAACERLRATGAILEAGCLDAVRHVLWSIEGSRQKRGLPSQFPHLSPPELWQAGIEGLREAIATGTCRRWDTHLFNCVASACRLAEGHKTRKRPLGRRRPAGFVPRRIWPATPAIPVQWDDETRWEPTPQAMRDGAA
jgi:hypothetical protein